MYSSPEQKINVLVHIGAGRGDELPEYLEEDIERIVLVEPNPEFARKLSKEYEDLARVEVWEVAVASSSGKGLLNVFNWPEASSLVRPTTLTELFPGLTTERQHQVQTINVEETFHRLALQDHQTVHLVIEARGLEATLVDALLALPVIRQVSGITLTCGKESFYEGARPVSALLEALRLAGYEIVDNVGEDPDFPTWTLHRNALKDQLDGLADELKQTTAKLDSSEQKLVEEQKRRAESAETVQDLEAQLAAANENVAQASRELEKLKTDGNQRLEELQTQLHDVQQESSNLKERHAAELDGVRSELQASLDTLRKDNAQLTENLSKSEQDTEVANKQLHLAKNENEALQKRLVVFQNELSKAEAQIELIKDLMVGEAL